jgi:hypothetical protein
VGNVLHGRRSSVGSGDDSVLQAVKLEVGVLEHGRDLVLKRVLDVLLKETGDKGLRAEAKGVVGGGKRRELANEWSKV